MNKRVVPALMALAERENRKIMFSQGQRLVVSKAQLRVSGSHWYTEKAGINRGKNWGKSCR